MFRVLPGIKKNPVWLYMEACIGQNPSLWLFWEFKRCVFVFVCLGLTGLNVQVRKDQLLFGLKELQGSGPGPGCFCFWV